MELMPYRLEDLFEINLKEEFPMLANTAKNIGGIRRIPSKWRSVNEVYSFGAFDNIGGESRKMVLKVIHENDAEAEIRQLWSLNKCYPFFSAKIIAHEKNAVLMEFVEGQTYFEIAKRDDIKKFIRNAGGNLGKAICGYDNGAAKVGESFGYSTGEKQLLYTMDLALRVDASGLLKAISAWDISCEQSVIHNDLNCANLLLSEDSVRCIDPKGDSDCFDLAKDLGRYFASVCLNDYDYFGNDASRSLDILEALADGVSEHLQIPEERTLFYFAQSALSFSRFHTHSVDRSLYREMGKWIFRNGPKNFLGSVRECFDALHL